jgi:hypothetical protein
VQSGIGTLTIDAAVPAASRLQIGALFELADGQASTVDLGAGRRVAPSPPHAPVLVARRERFEQVAVDLRRCRELRRLAIYGLSPSMQWSGTLVLTTFGGGRVEVPLEPLETAGSAVLVTAYNVRGERVIRAELTPVAGVRDAARAFGYDRITWLDDRNPVA